MMVEWVSELIWHLRRALSSLENTRGVWCNTNRRKAALHRSTRWINHQPVNKSVSISSWIVAFVTLKWIWYFSWALLCVVAIDHCFEPETRRWHLWFRLFTKPIGGDCVHPRDCDVSKRRSDADGPCNPSDITALTISLVFGIPTNSKYF